MRITGVETVRLTAHPEYLWVVVETDEGLVGTGETMPRVGSVERVVHDVLAPVLIGAEVAPEALWQQGFQTISYHGFAGVELRALSAVDIALWDLVGQAAGLPVHRLLGGPCRDRIPAYNSCASSGAIRDHERFTDDPAGLARELVDEGFPAMKIWPFDVLSTTSDGHRIDQAQLVAGCRAFAAIRDVVGDDIDIALEGHSCWGLPAAVSIAAALEEFRPMWLEDMLHARQPGAWAQLRESTSIPLCGTERAFTRWGIGPYLDAGAVDVVNQDLCWTGGFTEFTKVAALAALHELPVAPHNCHGPVGAMATVHAAAAIPNLYLLESVRAFTRGFFADLVDDPPLIDGTGIAVPELPGLGVRLRDDVLATAHRERSDADTIAPGGWGHGDPWAGGLGDRI